MLGFSKLVAFAPTTDYDRARKFYEQVLGLHFVSLDSFALVMESGGTQIRIAKVPKLTPQPFTVLGWNVSEIEGTVTQLTERGVTFEQFGLPGQDSRGVWTSPGGAKVAWFKDPDANVLSITQAE